MYTIISILYPAQNIGMISFLVFPGITIIAKGDQKLNQGILNLSMSFVLSNTRNKS
jgi:hypothetical protein